MFREYLPFWNKLSKAHQELICQTITFHREEKGAVIHDSSAQCLGLVAIKSGQLRAYILSEEGREITLSRLFPYDVSLLSASCVMPDIQMNVMIQVEKDTQFWSIPAYIFKSLMEESLPVSGYARNLLGSNFSELMWLMEQIMWKSLDKRLAAFLLEEAALEDTALLRITHEQIANHLGTAREVVTRMLRYFQNEGMVALTRGTIELIDQDKLKKLAN